MATKKNTKTTKTAAKKISSTIAPVAVAKRGPGRPRKVQQQQPAPVQKKRGRPSKKSAPVQQTPSAAPADIAAINAKAFQQLMSEHVEMRQKIDALTARLSVTGMLVTARDQRIEEMKKRIDKVAEDTTEAFSDLAEYIASLEESLEGCGCGEGCCNPGDGQVDLVGRMREMSQQQPAMPAGVPPELAELVRKLEALGIKVDIESGEEQKQPAELAERLAAKAVDDMKALADKLDTLAAVQVANRKFTRVAGSCTSCDVVHGGRACVSAAPCMNGGRIVLSDRGLAMKILETHEAVEAAFKPQSKPQSKPAGRQCCGECDGHGQQQASGEIKSLEDVIRMIRANGGKASFGCC